MKLINNVVVCDSTSQNVFKYHFFNTFEGVLRTDYFAITSTFKGQRSLCGPPDRSMTPAENQYTQGKGIGSKNTH